MVGSKVPTMVPHGAPTAFVSTNTLLQGIRIAMDANLRDQLLKSLTCTSHVVCTCSKPENSRESEIVELEI